jgi:hypothetical protein
MLSQEGTRYILGLLDKVPPMLSLYLEVNPANPANSGKAHLLRAKGAMQLMDVPPAVGQRVQAWLEQHLPQARTLALFATEDWLEPYPLQVELPLIDQVEARWGEPYLTPILYALDEFERIGVVFVDREKWRMFEVFLGEIEELPGAFSTAPVQEWAQLTSDSAGRRYSQGPTHSRAAANTEVFERRQGAWQHRFYKRQAQQLSRVMGERNMHRLVLMGPDKDVQQFANLLPKALRERVLACLPSLPAPALSEGRLLERVQEQLESLEQKRQAYLLSELTEQGVFGMDQVLSLLQQGRLRLVVAPWGLRGDVERTAEGSVWTSPQAAQNHASGRVERFALKHILPMLADRFGTRLEFVRGEAEAQLQRLGSLGGLERW